MPISPEALFQRATAGGHGWAAKHSAEQIAQFAERARGGWAAALEAQAIELIREQALAADPLVDLDALVIDEAEVARRAEHLRRAHLARISLLGVQKRREKTAARKRAAGTVAA